MFGDRFSTAEPELTVERASRIVAPLYEALNHPQKKEMRALLAKACHADYKSYSTNEEWLSRDTPWGSVQTDWRERSRPGLERLGHHGFGDRVIVRGEATGTPVGELSAFGLPAGASRRWRSMCLP